MKWPWSKRKAPPPTAPGGPAWPSDAYESVRAFCYFFMSQDMMPFRDWKASTAEVAPRIEGTAQAAVRGLQTRIYFWLLERHLGTLEAEIAKDGFLGLLSQLSGENAGTPDDLGRMTRSLLSMVDDAMNTAEQQGEKKIPTPSGDVVVPADYYIGMYMLLRMSDSPHYNRTDPDFGNDDWAIAECLEHGKDGARTFFTPMVEAIAAFDVNKFTEWAWRDKPGAHERHLQRRYKNLLFPVDRRGVTTADVLEARRKDAAEYKSLMDKVHAIDLPENLPPNWNDFLSTIREQIDELKDRARQIGGDTSKALQYLNDLRRHMANVWRECSKHNPEALRLYEIAEAAARERDEAFKGDFGNQLLRDDPCFPSGEVVPSLLCEDPKTVAAVWEMMPEANRSSLDRGIADCIHNAMAEGFDIGDVREQLHAIGWPRPAAATT